MSNLNDQEVKFIIDLFDLNLYPKLELTYREDDQLRSEEGCNEFTNAQKLSKFLKLSVKQIEGYLSDLQKKGFIFIEDAEEYGFNGNVVWLTKAGYETIIQYL